MTEPDHTRPGSSAAGYHPSSIPSSPRPSVTSRASGSSLRRERERQEALAHPRPLSTTQSHSQSQSPQPPAATLVEQEEEEEEPTQVPHETPSFTPFFTLLSSSDHPSQRQTTHHPIVHYIFADDDPEALSDSLAQHHLEFDRAEAEEHHPSPIRPGDRAVIVDMAPSPDGTGLEIAWASSLAPDWAIVSARVCQMEGGDGGNTPAGEHSSALMMKIEGVSIESSLEAVVPWGKTPSPEADLQSSSGSGTRQDQDTPSYNEYPGLLADFDKRMGLLRRVVESGADRQQKIKAGDNTLEESAQIGRERAGTGPSLSSGQDDSRD